MKWFRQLIHRREIFSDLSEEIQQHLSEKTEALMAAGMSREQAEHAAKREFGNVTRLEERGREAWLWPLAEKLGRDVKFALRQLSRNYGFALTAILTLALGIGATTAIFSLVNAVLLRPLSFPEQDRLMWLSQQDHSLPGVAPEALSYPDYFDWRAQNHSFSGIASYAGGGVTLDSNSGAQRLEAQMVSSNFFQVLGARPILGRDFRWEEEKPGNHAAMLSYPLWQSTFGGARDIAGKTIRMDDKSYTIAGVMPQGFQFPLGGPAPELWISLASDAEGATPTTGQRGMDLLGVIGRLKDGVAPEQAKADLSVIAGNLARQYPDNNKQYTSALVEPELRHMTGDNRPALQILFGAVMLVLMIACTNVAGLLLVRGSRRSAEFALRSAIGGSRAAIIRQLLVESVTLSLCGGVAGIALAFVLLRGMVRLLPQNMPRMEAAKVDGTVLLFVVLVSVVTGLLFGILPAWRISQLSPEQALRNGSRSVAGARGQHRVHNGLVIAQTAIGLVLLVSSGLLMRSFIRILNVDPGFDSRHVLTARMRVSFDKLSHDQHLQFYDQLVARISALPGVRSASAAWPLPMSDNNASVTFAIGGRPMTKADEPNEAIGVVMPGYFETMRIPLISGRTFGEQDTTAAPPVVIINQAFARKYFPHTDPLGQHIRAEMGDDVVEHPMRQVVGVVGDVKRKGLTVASGPQYFVPFSQALITNPYLVVRTAGDPALMQGAIEQTVHSLDKSVPVYQVATMEDYVAKSAAQARFQTLLLTSFAGIALILTAIGLYGLLSYMVGQRTLEIGLRMAMGAQRSDVLRMVVRRGLILTLLGAGVGLGLTAMVTRLLSGMLYGVRPFDPMTFAAMTGLLLAVGVAASSVPASRAARLDPMKTLREQ
ncbi:MAG TPA: ABC transporter permease [Acidobacteriaceae bacterium]|jgi:predicted permease